MVKFGEYLHSNSAPEWVGKYLDYDGLKKVIDQLEKQHVGSSTTSEIGTSLSVPRPTNAAGMPINEAGSKIFTQEYFFTFLESEMKKIEEFTKAKVDDIRAVLGSVEARSATVTAGSEFAQTLQAELEKTGDNFLKLEKYVNLNFTGFHKILKKHDRRLPNPCRTFYLARLHDQNWVRGDFSDVIVRMSAIYSKLRGDEEVEAKESERQDFVRSTRKYWVHTEDVSRVKYIVLQHLPVFLQKAMGGETDAQLVNSVYVDNHQMELYHGRLDKTPGAIALRMRWYGTGVPELVFVERKTHREAWTGDVSVKERFTIPENRVLDLLSGKFDIDVEKEKLQKKGKKADDIAEWYQLASEVVQAVNSKQLFPTMRTQYMRTAFQIPFDATVRISLDTNLTMIAERTGEILSGDRWYRDPNVNVPLNEITRFPHAVLEIKLQLEDENKTPAWVTELIESGMLLEVHKFSKFIHGCAVLMPAEVMALPYWIDDATLSQSINQSGASNILQGESTGANKLYGHLLPHDQSGQVKKERFEFHQDEEKGQKPQVRAKNLEREYNAAKGQSRSHAPDYDCGPWCNYLNAWEANHITTQKVEPKVFFANERTFIKWMEMAVIISSISIGILAFSHNEGNTQYIALFLLPLALFFIIYALRQFRWRAEKISTRDATRWDDVWGPVLLTSVLIFALSVQFVVTALKFANTPVVPPTHAL